MKPLHFFLAVALIFPAFSLATEHGFTTSPASPRQGDTIVVRLTEKPTALTFNSATISVFPYQNEYRAVIPLAATAKTGSFPLVGVFSDGTMQTKYISVSAATFPVIVLPVPKKLNQTSKQLVQNLAKTNKSISSSIQKPTQTLHFNSPFALPLYDNRRIGSGFGEIRRTPAATAGEAPEDIRHLGTDFSAKIGTPVAAINSGIVTQSYLDSTYGETIIIDHGYGIYTLYMHLNTRAAQVGEVVKKGTIIGTVGQTGYASGPHLHLSVKINGVSVDPLRFIHSFR